MSLEYRMEIAQRGEEYAIAVGSMESVNAVISNLVIDKDATVRVYRQRSDELVFEFCANGLSELA